MSLISRDLERFEAELIYNEKVLGAIETNLSFLKNKNIIVSLAEYKKIKQQYKLVMMKIEYYVSRLGPLKSVLVLKENNHKEEMKRFEEIYSLQFKNNVLEFPSEQRRQEEANP